MSDEDIETDRRSRRLPFRSGARRWRGSSTLVTYPRDCFLLLLEHTRLRRGFRAEPLGIGRGNFFRTTLRRFRLGIDGAVWFRRANLAPADA
ncbi:MAG TPA: hypothetical protein PKL84_12625 [Candidatus Hydrogenedentes bacterium]|nr:hypothetical protein [Candidatus Hydrogenedentota bacterium]